MGDPLNTLDTVDMGAGTDTIKIDPLANSSTTTLTTSYNLTGVENVQVTGADEASLLLLQPVKLVLKKLFLLRMLTVATITVTLTRSLDWPLVLTFS